MLSQLLIFLFLKKLKAKSKKEKRKKLSQTLLSNKSYIYSIDGTLWSAIQSSWTLNIIICTHQIIQIEGTTEGAFNFKGKQSNCLLALLQPSSSFLSFFFFFLVCQKVWALSKLNCRCKRKIGDWKGSWYQTSLFSAFFCLFIYPHKIF